jgi:hypothetical protein
MAVHDEESKVIGAGDAKDSDYGREPEQNSDTVETESQHSETQAGVKKVEAISKMWTMGGLVVAYVT